MSKGEVQYIADTLLIEKLFSIEEGLTKEAGLVDAFKGIAESIKEQISERVQKEGVLATVVSYLAPVVLGRIWPPLGIALAFANLWGFDTGSFMNDILGKIKPKIESGQTLTLDEVHSAGLSSAQSMIGGSMEAESSNDFFGVIRKIEAGGKLVHFIKTSQSLGRAWRAAPFMRGSGGVIGRIFGRVGALKGKWFIAGIIIWFIKTVLLGAGVIEGSTALSKAVGLGKKEDKPGAGYKGEEIPSGESPEAYITEKDQPEAFLPAVVRHNLKPSGQGEQYHINDGNSIWVVPLLRKSVRDTLLSWALEIYPELKGHENELLSDSTFNNVVYAMSRGVRPESPGYLIIPENLHTRSEIIQRAIGPVAASIKDLKNEN